MRVGVQHMRFMSRARPISEEIERTTDPGRRERLELVLAAREFAAASGLDVGGSYLKISDTTGLSTAYVVTAAYDDRLEPYNWSYPIIGKIPYRGYFDREDAERFGATLAEDGYDIHIVEAAGYSTLGWFDDPLPSGVLEYEPVALAELIIHELVHQTLYVPGHIAFNETLASAVAARLTVAFFEERGQTAEADEARERRERWLVQSRYLDGLAANLVAYFEASRDLPRDEMLAGRRQIYLGAIERMSEIRLAPADPEPDLVDRMNNAVLLAVWRYRDRADVIDAFLARHESIPAALDALGAVVDGAEDPYTAVAAAPSAVHSPGQRTQ